MRQAGITGTPVSRSYPASASDTVPKLSAQDDETLVSFDGEGNFHDRYFKGKIKSLHIQHFLETVRERESNGQQ